MVRGRPSAPHPPLSAAGASQSSHCGAEGAQLRRISPRQGSGRCHIPDTESVRLRMREACLSCGCQLIGLVATANYRDTGPEISVLLRCSSGFVLIHTAGTDLGTVYCAGRLRTGSE